jgi:hypothetical protein
MFTGRLREQIYRFCRLFAFTLIPQIAVLGAAHLTRSAVISIVVGALETAFRLLYPQASPVVTPAAPDSPAVQ